MQYFIFDGGISYDIILECPILHLTGQYHIIFLNPPPPSSKPFPFIPIYLYFPPIIFHTRNIQTKYTNVIFLHVTLEYPTIYNTTTIPHAYLITAEEIVNWSSHPEKYHTTIWFQSLI